MIWFNLRQLEEELRNKDISDKKIFSYLLASLVVFTLASYTPAHHYDSDWSRDFEICGDLAITIIGTMMAFNANSKGDNTDFFRRFIALSFVIAVRLGLIVAIPMIALTILHYRGYGLTPPDRQLVDIILYTILAILYYFLLLNSFKRVSARVV